MGMHNTKPTVRRLTHMSKERDGYAVESDGGKGEELIDRVGKQAESSH